MRRGLLHLAALAACLAAGCGREAPKEAAPLRIVSTSAAATHILLALGAEEELAAIDSHGSIVPGAEHIPVAGRGSVLSLEELTRLRVNRADAVVLSAGTGRFAARPRHRGHDGAAAAARQLRGVGATPRGVDRPEAGSAEAGPGNFRPRCRRLRKRRGRKFTGSCTAPAGRSGRSPISGTCSGWPELRTAPPDLPEAAASAWRRWWRVRPK